MKQSIKVRVIRANDLKTPTSSSSPRVLKALESSRNSSIRAVVDKGRIDPQKSQQLVSSYFARSA